MELLIKKVGKGDEGLSEEAEILNQVYVESLLTSLVKLKNETLASRNEPKRNFDQETQIFIPEILS
jgi:hypothetical protein|tara:strand:+ start:151 stop:348 length:198 start_codon:yes stop_codon:yes gene_type:complete